MYGQQRYELVSDCGYIGEITFCANLLFNKCEAICILIDICFFFFFNSSSL